MGLPQPEVALTNICSTIYNNTLYTYSAEAFQSLSIEEGAQWSKLSMGESVTGGVCVQATPKNNDTPAALYIVGGTSNTSTTYPGLQRYLFDTAKWETITPLTSVTQNRLYHNAVYLNTSASILVYAGSQDGEEYPSSQTFTINTTEPHDVIAYESKGAPPAVQPLLMPWSESKAVMLGGGDDNDKVFIFSPSSSWEDSNTTLAEPLKAIDAVKGIIINGDDGSKNLYTLDMTTSPNTVNRTVLVDGNGNPVPTAAALLSRSINNEVLDGSLTPRNVLNQTDWPKYNDTLAPDSTRSSYALAKDQSGMVVVAGGNTADVLCIFRARQNAWVNASATFNGKSVSQQGLGTSFTTSTSTSSSTTPTASSSFTAAATSTQDDSESRAATMRILGIVLGTIGGIALFLALLLLLLRWKRNRRAHQEAGHQRRASGIPDATEKETMELDRGIAFRGHGQNESQGSFSSMAILMGNVRGTKNMGTGGMVSRKKGSNGSDSSSAFNKRYKTAISKPILQETQSTALGSPYTDEKNAAAVLVAPTPLKPPFAAQGHNQPPSAHQNAGPVGQRRGSNAAAKRGSTRRSSGWNRYWSGGNSLSILGFGGGSKRNTYGDNEDASDRSSNYSDQPPANGRDVTGRETMGTVDTNITQVSALPAPLKLADPPHRMSLNRVHSASPTVLQAHDAFPQSGQIQHHIPQSGMIDRHNSVSSVSSYDTRDAFSSGVPESIVDEARGWDPVGWGIAQPTGQHNSVAYSESNYGTTVGGPRTTIGTYAQQVQHQRNPSSASRPVPDQYQVYGGSQQQQPRQPHVGPQDMSWLNLEAERRA